MRNKVRMKNILHTTVCLLVFGFSFAQNEVKQDTIKKELNEVIVKGTKKTFSNTNGNLKIDVANSNFKSATNTIDLLSKLPNIQISPNKETISIIGKSNPLLYIDNQKATLNDLKTLSVDDIKSIEIVKNPSSKYEAEGKAVILITRKFSKKEGFKIDLTETASFKKRFNNYLGFNASVKKKKLELKTNFHYNQLNVWEKHHMNYQIPIANIISDYGVEAYTKRPQFIFGGGFFYKINEDDYLSFSANARFQDDIFGINTKTFNRQDELIDKVITSSDNDNNKKFINSFVNYSKKIKSINTQFFTGFQYSNYKEGTSSLVQNNPNETQFKVSQNSEQQFNVAVFSGRADVEKSFKNEMKLEIGGLFLDANAKTNLNIIDFNTTVSSVSNYDFKEQNTSGYSQFSGKIKKIDYIMGFRIENTHIEGKYKNENAPLIQKNYTHFFPKAQVGISIDSSKTLTLNYSKSIIRPNYSNTNQGSTYINPYFIYGRNINLDPTICDEIAVNFQWKDKSVTLSYSKNSNPVYGDFSYDNQQNILTFSQKNFDVATGYNLDFTLPFTYEFWTMSNNLILILNKIEDDSAKQNQSEPYVYYYSNNVFRLPKEYSISVTAWGLTTQKEGVFEINQPKLLLDLSVSKIFFKNWDCTLSFNDIFKSSVYRENFTINSISSKASYLMDTHEIALSVKYTFGKIKDSEYKEKSINENENRIR